MRNTHPFGASFSMRRIVLVLVAILLFAQIGANVVLTPDVGTQTHERAVREIERKSVALVLPDKDGSLYPYCAGVWVSNRSILTAYHCVDGTAVVGYVVRDDDLIARGAVTYAVDDAHDLALLQAVNPPVHDDACLRVDTAVRAGMFSQTVGHPGSKWWTYSSGTVTKISTRSMGGNPAAFWVQATTPLNPGNSGGGLFDGNQALIGVAARYTETNRELNYFVHPVYIAALLEKARSAGEL